MRYFLSILILSSSLYAIDYSNMFLTNERPNPYSEANKDESKKETNKERTSPIIKGKKKSPSLMTDTSTVYQMQFGFESEDGYDDNGYGLVFSTLKPMPNWSEKYKGAFVQADLLYTINELKNTTTGSTKDYLAISGYAGYLYDYSDKTSISARIGSSFITSDNSFRLAYALGVKRKMLNSNSKLIANWLILNDMTLLSFGLEFSY